MNRYFILLLCAVSLSVSLGLSSNANKTQSAFNNGASLKLSDNVDVLTLSDTEIFIPCKIGYVPTESCPDKTFIYVDVKAQRPDDEDPDIKYTVSGGRIIGTGGQVKWDFSDVTKAGIYDITVSFINWNGERQSKTETVTLRSCDCPNDYINSQNPATFSPTPTPKPLAEIERIELDKDEVIISCPLLSRRDLEFKSPCYDNFYGLVKVKTFVNNPKNVPLTYQYTVSGGRITGEGPNIMWDLSGIRPGQTHTITVSIKGNRGVSDKTRTQQITIRDCFHCPTPCVCPTTFTVTGKEKVRASESLIFTANVLGGTATDIKYNWTVSQGEIVSGQGTPQIKVKTTREMTGTITAAVEISGTGLCEGCNRVASATVEIVK